MDRADLRKQAWDFFQMQAGHRLTTFNFYISVSSLLLGGLVATLKGDLVVPYLGVLLGSLLVFYSFLFWKLDSRNRDLIKGCEETLKYFESQFEDAGEGDRPHVSKRFMCEEFDTKMKRVANSWRIWRNHYSYSQIFQVVFCTFAFVGFLGVACSLVLGSCQ